MTQHPKDKLILDQIQRVIEETRLAKEMSTRELSKKAGVSHSTYWSWVSRGHVPSIAIAVAYMRVLEIPFSEIKG